MGCISGGKSPSGMPLWLRYFAPHSYIVQGDDTEHGRIGAVGVNLRLIVVCVEWVIVTLNPAFIMGI
jgi:hypothetical protein